jgi:hypothetical protein
MPVLGFRGWVLGEKDALRADFYFDQPPRSLRSHPSSAEAGSFGPKRPSKTKYARRVNFGRKRPGKTEYPGCFNRGVFLHLNASVMGRNRGFARVFELRVVLVQYRGREKNKKCGC